MPVVKYFGGKKMKKAINIFLASTLIVFAVSSSGFCKQRANMEKHVLVTIETTLGNIELELDREKAPITVENFLKYLDSGSYDGTIFHRVIPGFMIQGGGFDSEMHQKPTNAPIKNEAGNGLKNDSGTIAMARTGIVDSATSQFFINVNDNYSLNHRNESQSGFGYAVFGKVTKGMDVAQRIVSVPTTIKGHYRDVPEIPVVIKSIKRVK